MHTAFSCLDTAANPFAQMVDRSAVLAAVHHSERLNALVSHVFRPLAWQSDSAKGEGETGGLDQDLDD